jgi:tetratricopeptide (TPR) repeat protein
MAQDQLKEQIKKTIGQMGHILGGGAGPQRLVVLRCTNLEQIQTAMQLLPRAFPKVGWKVFDASQGHILQVLKNSAQATQAQETVSILYNFPGEADNRTMTKEAAMCIEQAAKAGALINRPLLFAVHATSVRALADNAKTLWKGKGGYFSWPTEVVLPERDESAPTLRTAEKPQESAADQGLPSPEAAPAAGGRKRGDPALQLREVIADWEKEKPSPEETRKVLDSIDGTEAADYLLRVARSHLTGGDAENARLFLLRAVQIYSQAANLGGMATAYHLLGVGAQIRCDYETAIQWFEQAIDSFRVLDDKSAVSEALGQKGYSHYLRGQYDPAVRCFEEALKIDQNAGYADREAAGYRKIAMVLEVAGKFSAAEELLQKSMAIEEKLASPGGKARVLHHLGRLKEVQKQWDEAVSLYGEALKLKEQQGDKKGLAASYHQLGNLNLQKGDFKESLANYDKAVKLENELGDRLGLARTLAQVGIAYRDQGLVEEALNAFVRAYQIFQRLQSPVAAEILMKVEELQGLVTAEAFNRILKDATTAASSSSP